MTELKRYEHTLQQKNAELEDASRLKSEFLANMSHELRTPLNAIIGFSEVLRDGLMGDMTEKQRGFIGDIFNSGTHLLLLINDILDLSKVEAGKMTLDLEPVAVSALFANSLSIIREKAATRRIRLTMDVAADVEMVHADARKVKQIIYNLLSNAVKFSADGGEVILRASRVASADVGSMSDSRAARTFGFAGSPFEHFLKITVSDTGIGIPPEGLGRLFTPFTQIDGGLARKFEGTGLGLAMVKLLAELHGGSVAVASAVAEGSAFTVWLPLRPPAKALPPVATDPRGHRAGGVDGPRIALVVEDDVRSAQLIRVQLEAEGFKVLVAATAEAGLLLAEQEPLALITLDLMLPGIDGWDFLAHLKSIQKLQHIPVVVISIVADRDRGFALGAAAVMQKPISRKELYEALVGLGLLPLETGRTLKVLVVDDDPSAVEVMAMRMQGMVSTVLRAYGGAEAIEIARSELPDLIVLDLVMPNVTGFDVVDALNGRADTARIPILVVTAKAVTGAERDRLDGRVSTILEKAPFNAERFKTEVRRAMGGRRAND
jgi:signal transduction histidine kinase/CheY-like chemotaxis protein